MIYWLEDFKPLHNKGIIKNNYLDNAIKNNFIGLGLSYDNPNDLENIINLMNQDNDAIVFGNGSIAFTKFLIDYEHKMFDCMKSLSKNYHNLNWMDLESLKEHFLSNKTIITLKEFKENYNGRYFIKSLDHKKFTGFVYNTNDDFITVYWKKFKKYPVLDNNMKIIVSDVKKIQEEYRFIVLDGKVLTYSQYAGINKEITNKQYDSIENIAFKAKEYDRIFSLDITIVNDIPYIVEINPFWSSGVYNDIDTYIITSKIYDIALNYRRN